MTRDLVSPALIDRAKIVAQYILCSPEDAYYRHRFCAYVAQKCGYRVISGPFKGMHYIRLACGSELVPKLLGTYELELHDAITRCLRSDYHSVVNVGSAEGYYAVGFARFSTNISRVYAFDTSGIAQASVAELAKANDVHEKVFIFSDCNHDSLNRLSKPGTLVICDIEGGEGGLLDPAQCPGLLDADLIVEVHDGPQLSSIRDELRRRFSHTHSIEHIVSVQRTGDECDRLPWMAPSAWRRAALDERRRVGLDWLVMSRNGSQ